MTPGDIQGSLSIPAGRDLDQARMIVGAHHPRTLLLRAEALSRLFSADVFVKYENQTPIRSFKARGALYCLASLSDEARGGVVTASTGNHGQGIAYAGGRLGITPMVVVPRGTPELKVAAIRHLGGEIKVAGADIGEANQIGIEIAATSGRIFIEDGDDAGLMAGAATVALEVFEELPDADVIVVPVGSGNLIAAVALASAERGSKARVLGVQSDAAPAVYRSWKTGQWTQCECRTFAGGLATPSPGRLAFEVIRQLVDEIVLVSEDDLRRAIVDALRYLGQVVEGAGAAGLAALARYAERWRGQKVVLILTGGNLPFDDLLQFLAATDGRTSTHAARSDGPSAARGKR